MTNRMGRFAPAWRRIAFRAFTSTFFLRRARAADGDFDVFVSPGCHLSVLDPRGVPLDPVHQRFIARWVESDSVVWDIGGNMGLFAFPAGLKARSGQVYTFEPDIEIANYLGRSARRAHNRAIPVRVFCFAVSDSDGTAEFLISDHGRAMNKLAGVGEWHDYLYVARESRSVATLRIDALIRDLRPPNVIKIDVEGAELRVLNGGRETIAKHRPVFLIEGPDELKAGLTAFFEPLDYRFYEGESEPVGNGGAPSWNTIAVPREKWPHT